MDDDREELITRWWTPAMESARADVERVLAGEKGFGQLDLRTPDGLADVRGYQFPDPPELATLALTPDVVHSLAGWMRIEDAAVEDVDFSHATMRLWEMTNVELTNCRFHATDLMGLRIWQSDVTGCDLTHANLRDSTLGGMRRGRPTVWTGCDFTAAHLLRADLSEGDLYECRFDAARLDGTVLRRVTMQDCRFSGLLVDVTIDGTEPAPGEQDVQSEWWLDDVDLTGCLFQDTTITGYALDTVRLPTDPLALDGLTVSEPGPPTDADGLVAARLPSPERVEEVLRTAGATGSSLFEEDRALVVSEDRDLACLVRPDDDHALLLSMSEFDEVTASPLDDPDLPASWRAMVPDAMADVPFTGLFAWSRDHGWRRTPGGVDEDSVLGFLRLGDFDEAELDAPEPDEAELDETGPDALEGREQPADPPHEAPEPGPAAPAAGHARVPLPRWLAWIDALPASPRGSVLRWTVAALLVLLVVVCLGVPVAKAPAPWHPWLDHAWYAVLTVWAVLVCLWAERRRPRD